jgi:hypothetical protein
MPKRVSLARWPEFRPAGKHEEKAPRESNGRQGMALLPRALYTLPAKGQHGPTLGGVWLE